MDSTPRPLTSKRLNTINNAFSPAVRSICLVVGLACIFGFLIDMIVLGFSPSPLALEWRVNFLQQISDRSVVLFLGIALLLCRTLGQDNSKRLLSFASLVIGLLLILSCILVVRDVVILKNQASQQISNQVDQLQTEIEVAQDRAESSTEFTPEQVKQFSQRIKNQARIAERNTLQGITRSGFSSVGNLAVIGIGFTALGRFGLSKRRQYS